MTGSGLIDFLIGLIVLCAAVAMIYRAIPFLSPDGTFTQIARWAIGVVALIALLKAAAQVFFGGGGSGVHMDGLSLIYFAIGLIVLLVVVYLIYYALAVVCPAEWLSPVKYVIGALALIVLLLLAAQVLFGANVMGGVNLPRARSDLPLMLLAA